MREHVDLPDEDRQRLVHPMDLPDARRSYVRSLWLREAASPQFFFLLAALLWAVSNNFITPLAAPLSTAIFAALAARNAERDSWSYIPRWRHDLARETPGTWVIAGAAFRAGALFLGLAVICIRAAALPLPEGVAAWTVGSGAAVAVLMGLELVWALRTARANGERVRVWPQVFTLAAVIGAVALAVAVLSGEGTGWRLQEVAAGAAVIVGVQVIWWISQARPRRRLEEQS